MKVATKVLTLVAALSLGPMLLAGQANARDATPQGVLSCSDYYEVDPGGSPILAKHDGHRVGTVFLNGYHCTEHSDTGPIVRYYRYAAAILPEHSPGWRTYVQVARRPDGSYLGCWVEVGDPGCRTRTLSRTSRQSGYTFHGGATMFYHGTKWAVGGTPWLA
jgi:hypothetical protein